MLQHHHRERIHAIQKPQPAVDRIAQASCEIPRYAPYLGHRTVVAVMLGLLASEAIERVVGRLTKFLAAAAAAAIPIQMLLARPP